MREGVGGLFRQQPDGGEVNAFDRDPRLERRAGQRERQAGCEAEDEDDREVAVVENR